MPAKQESFLQWFRNASPYINAHRGRTFVLMLPGQCFQDGNFQHVVNDIALLNSLGIRLVLVHGARPQIDTHLAKCDFHSSFHRGLRITESGHMPAITRAVGELRVEIEAALSAGLPNSPLQGAHIQTVAGNFVTAMPQGVIDGVDLQYTGTVRRINGKAISTALDHGAVVLVSNLGYSLTGEIFNLCYNEVATHIAASLKADKLIAFTDTRGVVDEKGQLQREFTLRDCERHLREEIEGDSILRLGLTACYEACRAGVPRAHLISYQIDGALLEELFSRDGAGTMIHSDSYETLRQATIEDVGGILELLEPLERQGTLVRRSRELLETEIHRFRVIEKDGAIIACAALYPFEDRMAELAAVATRGDYRNQGRGALLLKNIEQLARQQGIRKLFLLTTQTAHWFIEQGFEPAQVASLPEQRQHLYNYQRNSKVFVKHLSDGLSRSGPA
ncbi:amino-acid N-acetyltransferase [Gilvimarinus sp. F26214L]|uniref:amino-acid N-acetyltransferase n=1 Tax=Gilvimarinus sp. DZF01 TaxID=3461371 RepID=UPI004045AE83